MKKIIVIFCFVIFCFVSFCQVPFFFNSTIESPIPDTVSSVTIGSQIWADHEISIDDGGGGIYYPDGDVDSVAKYGYLYNWTAANRIVTNYYPGWHIPSESECQTLYASTSNNFGKIKFTGTDYWDSPNTGATNETGFNLKGAGAWYGIALHFRTKGYFWTTTTGGSGEPYKACWGAAHNAITYSNTQLDSSNPNNATSLRLIKD